MKHYDKLYKHATEYSNYHHRTLAERGWSLPCYEPDSCVSSVTCLFLISWWRFLWGAEITAAAAPLIGPKTDDVYFFVSLVVDRTGCVALLPPSVRLMKKVQTTAMVVFVSKFPKQRFTLMPNKKKPKPSSNCWGGTNRTKSNTKHDRVQLIETSTEHTNTNLFWI